MICRASAAPPEVEMPRIPDKPRFPNPQTSKIQDDLQRLSQEIERATDAQGEVDMAEIRDRLSGDATATKALDVIQDEDSFQRMETRNVSVGCGGGTTTREVAVEPKILKRTEVQSVLDALISARSKVEVFDNDADGKIEKGEFDQIPDRASGLAAKLATVFADGSVSTYRSEMRAWSDAIGDVRSSISQRNAYESNIVDAAKDHCESLTGAEAVAWAYRDILTATGRVGWGEIDEALKNAETSWLRFLPFFGSERGHLNDKEVKKHLGTDDLREFIADKKAAIEARLGGTYEAVFLKGTDIEGHEHVDDPDLAPIRSGC
jgi:hypothetical protein